MTEPLSGLVILDRSDLQALSRSPFGLGFFGKYLGALVQFGVRIEGESCDCSDLRSHAESYPESFRSDGNRRMVALPKNVFAAAK